MQKEARAVTGKKVHNGNELEAQYVQVAYHPSTTKGAVNGNQHFNFEPTEITKVSSNGQGGSPTNRRSTSVKNGQPVQVLNSDQYLQQKPQTVQRQRGVSAQNNGSSNLVQQNNMKGKSVIMQTPAA